MLVTRSVLPCPAAMPGGKQPAALPAVDTRGIPAIGVPVGTFNSENRRGRPTGHV